MKIAPDVEFAVRKVVNTVSRPTTVFPWILKRYSVSNTFSATSK